MAPRSSSISPEKAGHYAFIAGVFLALFLGLFPDTIGDYKEYTSFALIVLGLAVGFLNITSKESHRFLVAALAISMGSIIITLQVVPFVGGFLSIIFTNISLFVTPAALVVAIKTIYHLAEK